MKKTIYKIGAFLSTSALLVASLSPVAFGDNTAGNSTTGAESKNETKIENTNKVSVTNVSDARIVNNVTTNSTTGGNKASYNTLGGSVETGSATTNASIKNTANYNTTMVALGLNAAENVVSNGTTGYSSENEAEIENKNIVKVWNDNTALLDNNVNADSRTGGNRASYNTGAGEIETGKAKTLVDVVNLANQSGTEVTGLGGNGNNSAENLITGAESENEVEIENTNDVMVSNVSDAAVRNNVNASARTGRNKASYNTLGGSVETGNADVGVGLDTTANYNTTKIAMAMGGFGDNEAGTLISGYDSENESEIENRNVFEVWNTNNKGMSRDAKDYLCGPGNVSPECWGVFNNDIDTASTGLNKGNFNTGLGEVMTGMSNILKTVKVWLNDSFTAIN